MRNGCPITLSTGSRLGPYKILSPLGAGGMGEVYRARDPRLGREVALKVLPETLAEDRDRLSRFEREARAASALNHPNIVTIHEIGREGETAYIAMELVDGRTLREMDLSGPLPLRRLLHVACQIADGLAKAHAAGIVHRDLKPENVMVSKDGFAKILDFGLAKLVEPESGEVSVMPTLAETETRPGSVMGTVAYMSPEQASGEPLDFRSDQFSLGSILYEMATGKRAFQRKTAAETMAAIIREDPEPVEKLRPELPLPVRWMVNRCLAKEPEERYASTRDLARDLASVRDHISEVSSGSGALLAATTAPRRRIARLVAGAVVAAGLVLAGWAAARARSSGPPPAPSFRRLTFRQGTISNARFAPDGRTVVYSATWERDSGGTPLFQQWDPQLFQTVVGSPESRAFDFRGDILAISPSNELAIVQITKTASMLARVPMSGGTPRQFLENVYDAGADFSPDGRGLAISRTVDGKTRVEFPSGKVLVSDAHSPRFSPDGKTISFWEHSAPGNSIGVIDRDGKSKRSFATPFEGHSGAPCWRPDGREIWFTASGPGEPTALWAVDLSGRRRLLMRVPGNDQELDDISKDGKVLLTHHTLTRTVRAASAADARVRDLSWLDWSIVADLSTDGKTLLFTEQGEGTGGDPVVYIRGTDGLPAVRLGKGEARALSPDGRWVLASSDRRDRLLLLPTGPGEERALDRGGLAEFGWGGWLPDGRTVVFQAAATGGASRLWVQAVQDGKPRPISSEGVRTCAFCNPVSPDGRWVIGIRGDEWQLIPLDGVGQPRTVPDLLRSQSLVWGWKSDGRALYVTRRVREWPPIKVFLHDLETGQERLWKEIAAEQPALGAQYVRITPDGSAWVYSAGHNVSQLYVVEGLR